MGDPLNFFVFYYPLSKKTKLLKASNNSKSRNNGRSIKFKT